MGTAHQVIEAHRGEILRLWLDGVRDAPIARSLSSSEIMGVLPDFVTSLGNGTLAGAVHLEDEQQVMIEHHVASRLRQGSSLNEMLTEFAVLGRCITWFLDREPEVSRPSAAEAARVLVELHLTCLGIMKLFNENMLEDEQTMKLHLRRLRELDEPGRPAGPIARQSLEVIVEALGANAAVLRLFHGESNELVRCVSVGDAGEAVEDHLRAVLGDDLHGDAITKSDVDLIKLEVSEQLVRCGIRSLLGVRLSSHHSLRGVLYVGLRARRAFTAAEVRLLESLGDALTVQLDHADLFATLVTRGADSVAEGGMRDRFVGLVVHDLSGPLAAARARAVALLDCDRDPSQVAAAAGTIIDELDRAGELVQSLLAAQQVRAGHPLPMTIERCDLASLARSTAAELGLVYGARFAVDADPVVPGMWSPDLLRRALWNLAENAIRFGAAGEPVLIQVRRQRGAAELSVHNHGPALGRHEQTELFRPFAPPRCGRGDPPGLGLGLTLVWGCAEAHGGTVRVDSRPGHGTTFTLAIPDDSRPYAI
jgi:signal transduction histidine kinase